MIIKTRINIVCAIIVSMAGLAHGGVTKEQLAILFQRHCATLKYAKVAHTPFMILFSGTPGMGKSFVAQKLEDHYQAVRISTDQIRKLMDATLSIPLSDYETVIMQYLYYFFEHYAMPNKRFVLDASIDRKYVKLFPFCEQHKIDYIVIRLMVPRDLVVKRLQEREGEKAAWHLKYLDGWFADYQKFGEVYKDYILYPNDDNADLEQLLHVLDAKIS